VLNSKVKGVFLTFISCLLGSCESFKPQPVDESINGLKSGPGLFSGQSGEFKVPLPFDQKEPVENNQKDNKETNKAL
jgi:hypothetical protein